MECMKKIAGITREYPFISVLSYLLAQGLGCMGMFHEVIPPVVGFAPTMAVVAVIIFALLMDLLRGDL